MASWDLVLPLELPSANNLRQEEIFSDTADLAALAYKEGLERVLSQERVAPHQGWFCFIRLYAIQWDGAR